MREKFEYINFNEIKPKGWIYNQMKKDLEEGFVGHLDKLVPDLIIKDDIYCKNRLDPKTRTKNVGSLTSTNPLDIAYLWWNSETQSNWRDGLLRYAFLLESKEYINKITEYINKVLDFQDEDGYIGIYCKELRFKFNNENGELWAQSSLFRVLIGFYEATGEKHILDAVEKAMNVIMAAYPINNSTPFIDGGHGVAHGLTITDALERLYKLTGKKAYIEYAAFIYESYSNAPGVCEKDIQVKNLMDLEYKLKGHGVHTYEHIRALVTAYYATDDFKFGKALENCLEKIKLCLTPSGGPIGDEWIRGNIANSTNIGYEYCSIQELLDTYTLLLQKTGDLRYADSAEWILFNAGQGARNPFESSIAYLKTDNSYEMLGKFQTEQPLEKPDKVQLRYMYSPTHQKCAVCCVPNAGRLYPYFVRSMYMRDDSGIVIALYGPNTLETRIGDTNIKIEQKTAYPFELKSNFNIKLEKQTEFSITLRKPSWSLKTIINCENCDIIETKDTVIIKKLWDNNDNFSVHFEAEVLAKKDYQDEIYISYGPLMYALPINAEAELEHDFHFGNFKELKYKRVEETPLYLQFADFSLDSVKINYPTESEELTWKNSPKIEIRLVNKQNDLPENVTLIPLGSTILRRATFPNTD